MFPLLVLSFLLPLEAAADCAIPATVGVVICQPSAGSTIFQTPHFEIAASPASGSITDMKLFIDGRLDFENSGPVMNLVEGAVDTNGLHTIRVDATDSSGRHYEAQESFSVTGDFPASCPVTLGVRICSPTPGEVIPQNLAFMVGFRGKSLPISHVRAYVDGKDFADFDPFMFSNSNELIAGVGNVTAGEHNLTIVAWDTHGHAYKSSANFVAFYNIGCPPKGNLCFPILQANTPQDGDDVTSPFRVSAQVEFNTAPITAIKAYLDGRQVGESFGPVFDQPLTAAKGTHILELQAWDTQGKLYRVTENVNVQ
jgi:hypothetical protein